MTTTTEKKKTKAPDAFGDRMKRYEAASDHVLPPRLPVILRLDGNSFSKFTDQAKFVKPFDPRFDAAMNKAATATLKYVHGEIAYIQSDEITILLRNDQSHDTTPFLGNRVQKICSLAAATCAVAFNTVTSWPVSDAALPVFDCRVFVVPESEVNNVFLWRQKDAFKNCIGAYAYWETAKIKGKKTVQRELHGLSVKQRQEYIFQNLGVNANDLPTAWKRGRCVYRTVVEKNIEDVVPADTLFKLVGNGKASYGTKVQRSEYRVDTEIPEFNVDTDYIERWLYGMLR